MPRKHFFGLQDFDISTRSYLTSCRDSRRGFGHLDFEISLRSYLKSCWDSRRVFGHQDDLSENLDKFLAAEILRSRQDLGEFLAAEISRSRWDLGQNFAGDTAVYSLSLGNLKTLTPTIDWVHGLPTDRSTDYRYESLYGPPRNKIKNKNKDFTNSLSNRSLVSAKFQVLCWVNVTDLGSVLGTSYVIAEHYIFAISFAVALHKNKREAFFPSAILYGLLSRGFEGLPQPSLFLSSHSVVIMDER